MPGANFEDRDTDSPVLPCGRKKASEPAGAHWIEIELVGEDDSPVPWEEYVITLPDKRQLRGVLDDKGKARVAGLTESGNARVSFPKLDQDAWDVIESGSAGDEGAAR